jgi:uncharacterized membrane protein YraQ (UPF0718 family)
VHLTELFETLKEWLDENTDNLIVLFFMVIPLLLFGALVGAAIAVWVMWS